MISISKSQISSYSDVNGQKSKHTEINNAVDKNGKVFVKVSQKIDFSKNKAEEPRAAVQTEINIPSKGIHHVIKNDANVETIYDKKGEFVELKRTGNEINKINGFSKTNYSPHDMAEYIFWTGDEKGVALTIEEFLRERLMSRQEAINFLQSIKYDLDLMQSQYQRLGKAGEKISSKGVSNLRRSTLSKEEFVESPKEYLYEEQLNSAKLKPTDFLNVKSGSSEITSAEIRVKKKNTFVNKLNFVNDSNGRDYFEKKKSYSESPNTAKTFDGYVSDRDYNGIMERVKMSGLLQKENSLEEVIFELSKLMFSESLKNGNTEAQKAMQRFSAYLQTQVDNGRISENLQKKIFEILLFALMEALPEHPELLNRPIDELKIIFDPSSPTSVALKQLITLGISRLTELLEKEMEKGSFSERLFYEGGTLICLGLPSGFEFGIDLKCITTVDNLMGVKMIPPGLHYIYYSFENSNGELSPRIGLFHYFKKSEIIFKKWDQNNAELIDEKNEEIVERYKTKLKTMNNLLGAYPFDIWDRWKNLSSAISEKLVNKIVPVCGKIYSVLELQDTLSDKNQEKFECTFKRRKTKLFLCDEKFDDILPNLKAAEGTELLFSKIPEKCYPDNSTPSEITKHSLDSTYLLEHLLKQHENDILGEVQLSFVCFLIGLNFEAFEHWKKLIGILCSCDEGIPRHSEMFIEFISIINYQLQEVQEDFLVDIVAGSNFVYRILRIFFRNLESGNANGRLKTKGKRFQELLTEKLKWDFSDIFEEDADDLPVVVDI